jgi:hypothetical protein
MTSTAARAADVGNTFKKIGAMKCWVRAALVVG